MGNFIFLKSHWEDLSNTGELAENYVFSDPNTSMIKQGMFAERLVQYMLAYDGIEEPSYDNTHSNRIKLLKKKEVVTENFNRTVLTEIANDIDPFDDGKTGRVMDVE